MNCVTESGEPLQPTLKPEHTGGELLRRVMDFVQDCRAADPKRHYPHVGDIRWWFRDKPLDDETNWRFWQNADGRVVAVGLADSFPISFMLHPLARRSELEPQFCAWAMERRAILTDQWDGQPLPHVCEDVYASDVHRIAWLKESGYVQGGRVYIRYGRDLNLPTPEPQLPEGFVIRNVQNEEDLARRARLDYDAFEVERWSIPYSLTEEKQLRSMRMPGYDPQLDLVVIAPDGTWAAECMCWMDEVYRDAVIEPVGVLPAFRRQGLAKALLLEGFRHLKARGMERALLVTGHPSDNVKLEPQDFLYQSVGFREIDRILNFRKRLATDGGQRIASQSG